MLVDAALAFYNHLLTQEAWARDRLRPFAGQTARLIAGAFSLAGTITPLGFLRTAAAHTPADVTVSIPADALWRLSEGREALLGVARIEGRADFADTLSFLLRHLRWDAETDLAPHLGDILAHRLVAGGLALLAGQRRCASNFAANLAEYLRDERRVLITPAEMASLRAALADAEAACSTLERRIARLEA